MSKYGKLLVVSIAPTVLSLGVASDARTSQAIRNSARMRIGSEKRQRNCVIGQKSRP